MDFLKSIFRGLLVGVANVIPGVSGGTMAVSMGVYDKLIYAVTHLFKEFKKSARVLFPILLGILIGGLGFAYVVQWMFNVIPLITNVLFIGLIVGGMPAICRKIDWGTFSVGQMISFAVFLTVVLLMPLLKTEGPNRVLAPGWTTMILMFFLGMLASATMVIPGISGSMVLMIIGFYHPVINETITLTNALIAFDWNAFFRSCAILLPFTAGTGLGIFGISKVVELLLKKKPGLTYSAILGMMVASAGAVLLTADFGAISVGGALSCVPAMVAGCIIAVKLGD